MRAEPTGSVSPGTSCTVLHPTRRHPNGALVISAASAEEMRPLTSRSRWHMKRGTIARQVDRNDGARSICRRYFGSRRWNAGDLGWRSCGNGDVGAV